MLMAQKQEQRAQVPSRDGYWHLVTKNNSLPLSAQAARRDDYAHHSRLHYESAQLSRIQHEKAQEMNIAVFPGPHGNPSC